MTTAPRHSRRRALLAAALAAPAAGCGFQLRGSASLPYESLFVDMPESNALGAELKRNLRAGTGTRIVARREDAQATLVPTSEVRSKTILSLSSAGRVREFRLKYNFAFRVLDGQSRDIIAPVALVIERDFPFNDTQVLAKESEEALLYRDMQSDLVQQVLRRLAATAPLPRERDRD
jgi:LPS-assembly lipoprotein